MTTNLEISLSPISAKGDILSSNGSSRIRIPVGTNGQVMIAQSTSSSGISWYTQPTPNTGSFDLISTATATAAVASITINLDTTLNDTNYRMYEFVGSLKSSFTTTSVPSFGIIQFGTATSNYYGATLRTGSTLVNKRTTTSAVNYDSTTNFEPFVINTSGHSSNMFSPLVMYFWSNYQTPPNTREMRPVAMIRSSAIDAGAASGLSMMHASTILTTTNSSAEYTESITFYPGSGANFSVGSTISLYGYKKFGA